MKTSLFIANVVSAVFIVNILLVSPSITGFVVAPADVNLDLSSPLGIAIAFIIITLALDIYFYLKTKKEK